jgi:CheY-like chemotaxis protein
VPKTILVIEDQEQNLYLMRYMLEAAGYRVVLAQDGEEGIAAARAELPNMILLDIQLPTMSGHEVARALRAEDVLSEIPIVAVTSYAMPGDREEVIAAGCSGYIEKPINPDTFVREMERHMSGASEETGRASEEPQGGVE